MVSTDARSAVRSTFRPVPLAYGPELKAIRGLRSLGPAKRDLPANEHMGSVTELMHPTGLRATVGAALAFKLRGQARVAVAFFGDGATNTGAFHESLNLAQLWQVPVVFVCENNRWSESTPQSQHRPIQDLTQRAAAFGMRALPVDGEDVEAFHLAALNALQPALAGSGPVLLVCETERLTGHYIGDPHVYRDKDELRKLQETARPDREPAHSACRQRGGVGRARCRGAERRRCGARVRARRHRPRAERRAEVRVRGGR